MTLRSPFAALVVLGLLIRFTVGAEARAGRPEDVKLMIALPHEGSISQSNPISAPYIESGKFEKSFPVVIENISKKPLEFFTEGTSLGDPTMTFEVEGDNGVKAILHRRTAGYLGDGPNKVRLLPGEVYVEAVYIHQLRIDLDEVKAFEYQTHFKMRAILTQGVDPQDKMNALWKGSVTSEWIEINWIR